MRVITSTVNVFMILSVLGIIFSGVSLQEVYAPGPRVPSVALEVTADNGSGLLTAEDKDGVAHNTSVDTGSGFGPVNTDPKSVEIGDIVVITPGPGTKHAAEGELDTETLITIDGVPLLITIPGAGEKPQVIGSSLHTSCSKTIQVDVTTVANSDYSLLVVGTFMMMD